MLSYKNFLIPAAVAASLVVSACGGSSQKSSGSAAAPSQPAPSQSAGATGALVKTGSVAGVNGSVLVSAQGMTLYSLSGERAGKFICTSSGCLQAWHPLAAASASQPSGTIGSLGVVKRPDGTMQVTYKGMPLYTFAQDAPGQANGQGIKDVGTWGAVTTTAATTSTSGAQASGGSSQPSTGSSQPSSPASAPASSGGGYGY